MSSRRHFLRDIGALLGASAIPWPMLRVDAAIVLLHGDRPYVSFCATEFAYRPRSIVGGAESLSDWSEAELRLRMPYF